MLGGCGEQCDLWDEGQVSELGPYGPGLHDCRDWRHIVFCSTLLMLAGRRCYRVFQVPKVVRVDVWIAGFDRGMNHDTQYSILCHRASIRLPCWVVVVQLPQLVINTFGDMTKDDAEKDFYAVGWRL